jgi:NMD protein affecting ribosome stability and mRNA decay
MGELESPGNLEICRRDRGRKRRGAWIRRMTGGKSLREKETEVEERLEESRDSHEETSVDLFWIFFNRSWNSVRLRGNSHRSTSRSRCDLKEEIKLKNTTGRLHPTGT